MALDPTAQRNDDDVGSASGGSAGAKLAEAVQAGLLSGTKRLPAWMLYDARGSTLFEEITDLPEYYVTRTEREILRRRAGEIVEKLTPGTTIVELGAGTATKTRLLLAALAARDGVVRYCPIDVSSAALEIACERIGREMPDVLAEPVAAAHEEALPLVRGMPGPKLVLFLGSSIGNSEPAEARELIALVRTALRPGDALLLGTDLVKSPEILLPAYDDAQGVTAAFNRNVLLRINRELGGRFDPTRFRHVALWNDRESAIEMHLESLFDQVVTIEALGLSVRFRRGERIHTETSRKFTRDSIEAMLAGVFHRERTCTDDDRLYALHLARAF